MKLVKFCLTLCLSCLCHVTTALASTSLPAVALHYGANAPLDDLRIFDIVVVEPDHGYDPKRYNNDNASSELYAYAALTEVDPTRSYYQQIPKAWKLGRNVAWNSDIIDLSQPQWPEFFATQVIAPLWERGYRGFFIDTLDSYRLTPQFNEQQQQDGIVATLEKLHEQFPGIKLILNRGFEVLPRLKDKVQLVAAESMYEGWNPKSKKYAPVPAQDRTWLLEQLTIAREQLGIPGLVIDYVPPQDRAKARATAQKIQEQGFIPWVTDPDLTTIGIGKVELVPRRIAMIYDGEEYPLLHRAAAHRFLQMPLNYLGYVTDYFDVTQELPTIYGDRYAGVVTWFNGEISTQHQKKLQQFIFNAISQKIPFAWLGSEGFDITPQWAKTLGLIHKPSSSGALQLTYRDSMLQYELPILPTDRNTYTVDLPTHQDGFRALLSLRDNRQQTYVAAALTPWGGFVRHPYVIQTIPETDYDRWVIDPFAFVQQALRLQQFPVPDVTTENGRRLLFAHVDGDAFPSIEEAPEKLFAAERMLKSVLEKYRIPHAVSIIEAETAPHGLYPVYSQKLENIAKRIFALPHVEAASHTYSHPFFWDPVVRDERLAEDPNEAINLSIPGYTIDFHREIVGSIDYIKNKLAGSKPVNILLWSGDTSPNAEALKVAHENGILNMNGGDTFITNSNPSMTAVQGHGIVKNGYLQVYAPVTNENIYTNLWQGPYYGFQRVIETFELTEKPRRLKAVDIYYHTYSASKPASLSALHKVYAWAMKQPLHPIYPSEYIRKVQDFYHVAIGREGDRWRIRTNGFLRTVRLPKDFGHIDISRSKNIAGYAETNGELYIHLTAGNALLQLNSKQDHPFMALQEANGRIESWRQTDRSTQFQLRAHVPLEFSIASSQSCQLRSNGKNLKPVALHRQPSGIQIQLFRLPYVAASIQAQCASH